VRYYGIIAPGESSLKRGRGCFYELAGLIPEVKSSEPRVQVYNGATGILSTIPTREQAGGMMRVKMDGVEGFC